MLSRIYTPRALSLVRTSFSMVLNSLHVCSFKIKKNIAKTQFESFTFSQMNFREITRLNNTGLLRKYLLGRKGVRFADHRRHKPGSTVPKASKRLGIPGIEIN